MTILRVYKPIECDLNEVPLDWLLCRNCAGQGTLGDTRSDGDWVVCPACDGHKSLKAAAVDALRTAGATSCDVCGDEKDIDIRTLYGGPFDLRIEQLAMLCPECYEIHRVK